MKPALSQNYTNGLSLLGTKNAPTYPVDYMPSSNSNSTSGSGSPWGSNVTAYNSNPYKYVPDTGMTRKYKFVVTYQDIAPDGVTKKGLVVNGAFPGPTIEANWGDWIEVEVDNQLPDEGTTIHWHGLLQKGTPYYDGVPSVSQCPIAPGKTLTYRFRADEFGTTW
jgi:FtsP/CotA-like multicopper oxidase with cupredoxin domain